MASLEDLLSNLKNREKVRSLHNSINIQGDKTSDAYKEAAKIAYEIGKNAPNQIYNETIRPEDLEIEEVLEGLSAAETNDSARIRGILAQPKEALEQMEEDKFQEIATIEEIARRAGEGYTSIFRAYREYRQAKELGERDLKKLGREEMFQIYQVVAHAVERDTEKKLIETGHSAEYAQRIARLAQVAARAGHLSSKYLEKGREEYMAEAKKRLEEADVKEKARRYIRAVLAENDIRLNEGVAETIYRAYHPIKVDEKKAV